MRIRFHATGLAAAVFAVSLAAPALAGPPLVCHPFDIGTSASLPWESHPDGWRGERADYDRRALTKDTLALLVPKAPVIVRMETLRRAAIYASADPAVARDLLASVSARAHAAGSTPLTWFDAGYLVETYRQLAPIAKALGPMVQGQDGYAMVRKSLAARGSDPAMEFAAAMITADGRKADFASHTRAARAGRSADPLLARNVAWLDN